MNEFQGKLCPYCKTVIQTGEDIKVCPACGMPHHQACWEENKGCTTFGCAEQHTNPAQPHPDVATTYQQGYTQPQPSPVNAVAQAVKSDKMVAIPIIFGIIGLVLVIIGIFYPVPSREFSFRAIKEYVGGDAYNASIEAAIRGGEIAGAKAMKAIFVCGGLILVALSAFKIKLPKQSD
jgi:hypothetical protein